MDIDTTVYIDTEGRPWVHSKPTNTTYNKYFVKGPIKRISNEQAEFLFSLGYKKARKIEYP